jgi:lipopolysaccharide transport system ATP-binding protein
MAPIALKLDNVSKLYRLGEVGTGTLAHDLNRVWARATGREDPWSKVGQVNDREQAGGDYVWALRDVSFEVAQGEVIGIIGRNGAGKSTLLKLLSRVTAPSGGSIHINGRIASLLEVGTGFHPDLTGRENIFLNGAILGMSKREIRARFDEIVEFSGCAKYIDTPVKRYSSGMYVRLAFAVAAHLETDILIIDEVLAVGDAEFQKRCIGKMQEVSRQGGRTVLFVSHNMASIKRLCPRSVLMETGSVLMSGDTDAVVERYLMGGGEANRSLQWSDRTRPPSQEIHVESIRVVDGNGRTDTALATDEPVDINVQYRLLQDIQNLRISITATNADGVDVFSTSDFLFQGEARMRRAGVYTSVCHIPARFLNTGYYRLEVAFEIPFERELIPPLSLAFDVSELAHNQMGPIRAAKPLGVVHPEFVWEIQRVPARQSAA